VIEGKKETALGRIAKSATMARRGVRAPPGANARRRRLAANIDRDP
jgi:hypothetical protein